MHMLHAGDVLQNSPLNSDSQPRSSVNLQLLLSHVLNSYFASRCPYINTPFILCILPLHAHRHHHQPGHAHQPLPRCSSCTRRVICGNPATPTATTGTFRSTAQQAKRIADEVDRYSPYVLCTKYCTPEQHSAQLHSPLAGIHGPTPPAKVALPKAAMLRNGQHPGPAQSVCGPGAQTDVLVWGRRTPTRSPGTRWARPNHHRRRRMRPLGCCQACLSPSLGRTR